MTTLDTINTQGQQHCEKLLAALDAPLRARIQSREPYVEAVAACTRAVQAEDVELLKAAYRERWKWIEALVLTDPRDTIEEKMAAHYWAVGAALYAADPEKAGEVYGHPDHASYQDAITAAREAQDVKQLHAALTARWVFVNQLIDGTYATSELQHSGENACENV